LFFNSHLAAALTLTVTETFINIGGTYHDDKTEDTATASEAETHQCCVTVEHQ